MEQIHKTFSDVLEKANQDMDKYNPYHDNLGRFSSGNEASVTVRNDSPISESPIRTTGRVKTGNNKAVIRGNSELKNEAFQSLLKHPCISPVIDRDGYVSKVEFQMRGGKNGKGKATISVPKSNKYDKWVRNFSDNIDSAKKKLLTEIHQEELDYCDKYGDGAWTFEDLDKERGFSSDHVKAEFRRADNLLWKWDSMDVHKNLSDILEEANQNMDKYNPYHDQLGRFTSANSAKITIPYSKPLKVSSRTGRTGRKQQQTATTTTINTQNVTSTQNPKTQTGTDSSKYITKLRNKGIDISETTATDGSVNGWDIGVNGKTVHIDNQKQGDFLYNSTLKQESVRGKLGDILDGIDDKRDAYVEQAYRKYGDTDKLYELMDKYDEKETKRRGYSASDVDYVLQDVKNGRLRQHVTDTFDGKGNQTGWDVKVKDKTIHVDMPESDSFESEKQVSETLRGGLSSLTESIDYENQTYAEILYDDMGGDSKKLRSKVDQYIKSGDKARGYSADDLRAIREKL